MNTGSVLRQRAVANQAAPVDSKSNGSGTHHERRRSKDDSEFRYYYPPPQRGVSICTALLLCVFCIVGGLLTGLGFGVVGCVKVIGTYDYPLLDQGMIKLIRYLDLHFSVDVKGKPEEKIVSCTPDQPLVEKESDVFDEETFQKMKACLVNHPQIRRNHLNPSGFNGTRGFVIKFGGEKGIEKFLHETKFNCDDYNPLIPFFEKARHPKANGFVMNVLVCEKPSDREKLVVKTHVDDTLGHRRPNSDFLAHRVNVLYLNVPEDLVGGELELLGNSRDYDPDHPLQAVTPVENLMAAFRGDSFHQVRGYDTKTDSLRVSLVLENYVVSDENKKYLIDYDQSEKDSMKMM